MALYLTMTDTTMAGFPNGGALKAMTPAEVTTFLGLDVDLATLSVPASTTISAFGASLIDDAAATNALVTLGITALAAEVNYTTDVTSNIQAQMDLKAPLAAPTFTGIVTTAGQIKFPAAQSASADVNTLDDYEEGSWTPNFKIGANSISGAGHDSQVGSYTKIGKIVYVQGRCFLNSLEARTGNVLIEGLPFTAHSTSESLGSVTFGFTNGLAVTASVSVHGYVLTSSTTITIVMGDATTGHTSSMQETHLTLDGQLYFSTTYIASA